MAASQQTTLTLAGESQPQEFLLEPDANARTTIAEDLGILAIRKLRFQGMVKPEGDTDWRLNARLGATVVQSCVVTLEPVATRIDTDVVRNFVSGLPDIGDASEVEMPEDDSLEPLSDMIDLEAILVEALALNLPDFPRAEGVDAIDLSVTEPGKFPMTDENAKPFAGLASLRDSLKNDDENNS